MIPSVTGFLEQDFEIETQPTNTYKMELESNLIRGYTDGQEAMKQAIFKILSTERYQYVMYSWNYGIELIDLYGEPVSYVCRNWNAVSQKPLHGMNELKALITLNSTLQKRVKFWLHSPHIQFSVM